MARDNALRFKYDKAGHWFFAHQGGALLQLGGLGHANAWKSVQANLTLPAQTPDSLFEVRFPGRPKPDLVLIELCTYPDRRVMEQLLGDALLTYLDRLVLPEVVAIIFHPKGNLEVDDTLSVASPLGLTALTGEWRVVKMWELPAAPLLAADDPGLAALSLLTHFDQPPEVVFQQVRDVIDRKSAPDEHENLLAVCQIFAGLRYNSPNLLALFGGKNVIFESPVIREVIDEVVAEAKQKAITRVLQKRFGTMPADILAALKPIQDEQRLDELVDLAVDCPSYEAFQAKLQPGQGVV